jgi:hypothetical protein
MSSDAPHATRFVGSTDANVAFAVAAIRLGAA